MKAIVSRRYGPPEALTLETIERPVIAADEVLIRVRAASVNPIDRFTRGRPYLLRLKTGLRRPKETRVGMDVAGHVEAVGASVTRFQRGDEVFGAGRGAFAEYASARDVNLARKPANVPFEHAAATPIAGITALQCIRDRCGLRAGAEILINGAGGGVGTFAVQIAKSLGARVTAVCSGKNGEVVRAIGADHVIDYSREDFTRGSGRYDAIIDCVGNHSIAACRRVLRPDGLYVAVGAKRIRDLLRIWLASVMMKRVAIHMASMKTADLIALAELLESSAVVPVIGSRFKLSEVPEALRQMESGHASGKLVITIDA